MNGCKVKEDVTGSLYTVRMDTGGDKIVSYGGGDWGPVLTLHTAV